MNGWELNKIAGAVLLVATSLVGLNLLGDAIYRDPKVAAHPPEQEAKTESEADRKTHDKVMEKGDKKTAVKTEKRPAAAKKRTSKRAPPVAAACQPCHSFAADGKNKVGPHLWGVVGRQKASIKDFKYSKALNGLGGVWDEESLNGFLTSPGKYVKGTRMAFVGIKNAKKRQELIDWLKTLK